jgi:VWFA-related protein
MKSADRRQHLLILIGLALTLSLSCEGEILAQARLGLTAAKALRVDVDLVTLSFSVRDKNKHYVKELTKDDVVLLEDEVSQDIVFFDAENVPLSMVLLVDTSESVGTYAKEIRAVSQTVADLLHSEDKASVIAFSDVPVVLREFTNSRVRLSDALDGSFEAFSGATNINDSIYVAAKKLNSSDPYRRRVIVLISDGKGNRGERERALAELRNSQATVVGISLGLPSKLFRGAGALGQWVKETGGSLLFYSPGHEFRKELGTALEQIRSQYAVGYVSSNKNRDGHFRSFRVELSRNSIMSSKCAIIQDLPGYFAPAEEPLRHP